MRSKDIVRCNLFHSLAFKIKEFWKLLNSWHNDTIWLHWSWSTLTQVMVCCLKVQSHHLDQCLHLISEAFTWEQFHSKCLTYYSLSELENIVEKIMPHLPGAYCGLGTIYGITELGHHWFRWWLATYLGHVTTWTTDDSLSSWSLHWLHCPSATEAALKNMGKYIVRYMNPLGTDNITTTKQSTTEYMGTFHEIKCDIEHTSWNVLWYCAYFMGYHVLLQITTCQPSDQLP